MRVSPAAHRQLHIGQHVFVWREKDRKYSFAILNLSEYGKQVTLCGSRPQDWRFLGRLCPPPPEITDVLLASISSTLSSHSKKSPGIRRAVYTQNEAGVRVFVSEAVENKDLRANGSDISEAKQKELLGFLERGAF
jgi:hypothetical protein